MSVFSRVIVKNFYLVIGFLVEIFKERRFCDANERFGGLRLTGRFSVKGSALTGGSGPWPTVATT